MTPSGVGYSQNGKITRNDGTNWQNADAKGIWRPFGYDGPQEISFGVHGDRYYLDNPVYLSSIWNATSSTGTGQLYSDSIGETRTGALWVQDAWKIVPDAEADARRAAGNLAGAGRLQYQYHRQRPAPDPGQSDTDLDCRIPDQPELSSTNFSPKASLSYDPNKEWNFTANFGEAYRYPTVTELYQNITVNGAATFANPNLTPEQDFNGEFVVERKWNDGRVRLTLFEERTNNAIISQTNTVTAPNGTPVYRPRPSAMSPRSGCRASSSRRKKTMWPSRGCSCSAA